MGFGFTAAQLLAAPAGLVVGVGGTVIACVAQRESPNTPRLISCMYIGHSHHLFCI